MTFLLPPAPAAEAETGTLTAMAPTGRLLRLATAGSVDDGKSTLVGRLLYDLKAVMPDQLDAVERASRARGLASPDLALLTDGLRAEREQGITIDVAYRYFATPRRRFILADTPGHVQYTRNMVTGASTAQLAVILVDARHGVVEQTRRHLAIAALLRVPSIALLVNKMDLVRFDKDVYAEIAAEFELHAERLGVDDLTAIPICALRGDNIVDASTAMDWYRGPTFLQHLEEIPTTVDPTTEAARFPVQYVIRVGDYDYRGYAGQLASGVMRPGDEVVVLPSGRRTRIAGIDVDGKPVDEVFAPQSAVIRLTDDVDVSRGDLIAPVLNAPRVERELTATVCHLSDRTLRAGDRVLIRHTTRTAKAVVTELVHSLDITSLRANAGPDQLCANDIAHIKLRTADPLVVDDYAQNRQTGAFLLIDEATGDTLTAGMIGEAE